MIVLPAALRVRLYASAAAPVKPCAATGAVDMPLSTRSQRSVDTGTPTQPPVSTSASDGAGHARLTTVAGRNGALTLLLAAAPDAAALDCDRESASCSAPANAAVIFIGVDGAGVADAEAVPDADAEMDAERVVVPLNDGVPVMLAVEPADGEKDAVSDGDCGAGDADGDGDPVVVADADTFAAV